LVADQSSSRRGKSVSLDTRYLKSAKICYPLHPHYGETVSVLRELRYRGQAHLLCQIGDRVQLIPSWTCDALHCGKLTEGLVPRCDLGALLMVRQLIQGLDRTV